MAYKAMVQYPDLRLGQAIINSSPSGLLKSPWEELFYEECPVKASELFYAYVENSGKRKLTGKLDLSFITTGKYYD